MTALPTYQPPVLERRERFSLLRPSDADWFRFAASAPQASIFHHPAWLEVLAECYGYLPFIAAVRDASGAVSAGLPVMQVSSRLTGTRWVALPFTDYCQPLYSNPTALQILASHLADCYLDGHAPRIEVRWELPAHQDIQAYSHYLMHTLPLEAAAEQVKKRFHRTQRQNIGTAEKKGVRIERAASPEHLRTFYRLQLCTRRRQGVPVQPWRFFELIWQKLSTQGLGFILLAYKDEACLAGGLFLHWGQTLTYKYAASAESGQEMRPNNLLTWTAMQWGCEHGYALFDFGRSAPDNEGLLTFKRRWGADEQPLVYSLLSAAQPSAQPGMVDTLGKVIRRSPLWVCRLAGELFYRHVG